MPRLSSLILCNLIITFYFLLLSYAAVENYKWKAKETYYYDALQQKLDVILYGRCNENAIIMPELAPIKLPNSSEAILTYQKPPSADVVQFWSDIMRPTQMRVDPKLCEAVYIKKKPIFKNSGCQLPHYMSPAAPRCQTSYLKWICESAQINTTDTKPNHFIIPEADHQTWPKPPIPWLMVIKDAMVSMCGQISMSCGFMHTNANCKATGYINQAMAFARHCPKPPEALAKYQAGGNSTCGKNAPFARTYHNYDRIFVVAQVDDTFVYHIHLEIVPRILYYLDFLLANQDIKILYGCDTMTGAYATEDGLRQGLKALMLMLAPYGISSDRIVIHKHVFAREVYFPMEGACQDPVYNTWMILTMRKMVMTRLNLNLNQDSLLVSNKQAVSSSSSQQQQQQTKTKKKVMLLLKRSANSQHSRNRFDLVRQWSDEFTLHIVQTLQLTFPQYEVRLYSDRDKKLMTCFDCQVTQFAEASVLIGVHGAGLGMSLYMPPNSAVVEFAPYGNDGRCLLGGGPFSRLAAVMGHNYMMHHPPYQEFIWKTVAKCSEFNVTRFVVHIESFLKSIGEIK